MWLIVETVNSNIRLLGLQVAVHMKEVPAPAGTAVGAYLPKSTHTQQTHIHAAMYWRSLYILHAHTQPDTWRRNTLNFSLSPALMMSCIFFVIRYCYWIKRSSACRNWIKRERATATTASIGYVCISNVRRGGAVVKSIAVDKGKQLNEC